MSSVMINELVRRTDHWNNNNENENISYCTETGCRCHVEGNIGSPRPCRRGFGLPVAFASTMYLKNTENAEYVHADNNFGCVTGEVHLTSLLTFHGERGDQTNWHDSESRVFVKDNDVVTIYANIQTGGRYMMNASKSSKRVQWGGFLADVQSQPDAFEFIVRKLESTTETVRRTKMYARSLICAGKIPKKKPTDDESDPIPSEPSDPLAHGDTITLEFKSKPGYFLACKNSVLYLTNSSIGCFVITPPQLQEILHAQPVASNFQVDTEKKTTRSSIDINDPLIQMLRKLPMDIAFRIISMCGPKGWLKITRLVCSKWCALMNQRIKTIRINGEFTNWATQEERRAFVRFVQGCPNVTSLSLRNVDEIVDDDIACITPYLENLRVLRLGGCRSLSENAFNVMKYLPNLEHLNVAATNVSDATLELIFQSCPNLITLNLYACKHITSHGISKVVQLNHLKSINLRGTTIHVEYAFRLQLAYPRKEILVGPLLEESIY